MEPRYANGKICYIEMPATDVSRSAGFYQNVFGWSIHQRGDGATAFHDGIEVSGAFITGRPAATDPGFMIYIMVKSVAESCKAIEANGCEVLAQHAHGQDTIARFRDPAGNVVGLYEERSLS